MTKNFQATVEAVDEEGGSSGSSGSSISQPQIPVQGDGVLQGEEGEFGFLPC